MTAKLGADHPSTLTSMNNLAVGYLTVGKMDRALPLLEETLGLMTAKLGADHPNTLTSMSNLALGYQDVGKMDKALPLFEETLRLMTAKLGADHPEHPQDHEQPRSGPTRPSGRLDEALPFFEQAATGVEHRHFQLEYAKRIISNTIDAYEQARQYDKAEAWRRKWLAVVEAEAGAASPAYAGELAALGLLLLKQQKWTEAEPVLRECLAIREKTQPDVWTTFNSDVAARRGAAGPKEVRRRRAAAAEGLRGDEGPREDHPAAGQVSPPGSDRAPGATLRGPRRRRTRRRSGGRNWTS